MPGFQKILVKNMQWLLNKIRSHQLNRICPAERPLLSTGITFSTPCKHLLNEISFIPWGLL